MPAKTQRRHRQGDESRQRILQATLDIAAERGYDGTTVAQITKRAQLPASSVYWQFRNKDELLAAALEYSYRSWRREGPTWQPSNYTGTTRDRILTRLGNSRQGVEEQPAYWRLGLMVSLLRREERIAAQEQFAAVREETRLIIAEWWQTMLPAELAARQDVVAVITNAYLACVDGMFVAHRADPDLDLPQFTEVIGNGWADVVEGWASGSGDLSLGSATGPSGSLSATVIEDEDSRARLLRAAADVAAENGYRGTTVSRVCKRAGLPVSSLYWFFDDKEQLLADVVQHSWDDWLSHQPAWTPPEAGETWSEALTRILTRSTRSLTEAPSFMRIGHLLTLEQQETESAARIQFLQIRAGITEAIEGWFAANLPTQAVANEPNLPHLLAIGVIVFTDGYFMDAQISPDESSSAGFVSLLVSIFEAAVARAIAGGVTP